MIDVSGTGLSINVIASNTYPQGILCTAFADDTDPLDFPEVTIAEYGMGLNGDLITWSSPQPLQLLLPESPMDPYHRQMQYIISLAGMC